MGCTWGVCGHAICLLLAARYLCCFSHILSLTFGLCLEWRLSRCVRCSSLDKYPMASAVLQSGRGGRWC